jgi:hypothetical protein
MSQNKKPHPKSGGACLVDITGLEPVTFAM